LVEGIILVLLGFAAVFVPVRFGVGLLLFLICGITGLLTTFVMWNATGFLWSLLSAIFAMGMAVVMFTAPELVIIVFPRLLMAFLVLEGIVTVMLALEHWRQLSGRWGWMLASGIVDLSLAVFIVTGLPATATWLLGALLAVNLIFGGGAMIGMALAARDYVRNGRVCEGT
jgi:uncharacterized membrane protein HdeD (DUF308 family)